jgi:ElaB/YqjD/DUF883 family membrane-anchored ribosome-binding protein
MADNLRDKAAARYSEARDKVGEAYVHGKDKATDAAHIARNKAEKAAASTKAGAKQAVKKTVDTVDANPLAAMIGGLAIGAIAAALLPKTQRETKMVGEASKKIRSTAANAAKTARSTAKEQLDALGVNADAARDQIRDIATKIGKAASEATSAATDTFKKR